PSDLTIRTVFPPDGWRTHQWVPNAAKTRRPRPNFPRGRASSPGSPRTGKRGATPRRKWPVTKSPRVNGTPPAKVWIDRLISGGGDPAHFYSRRQSGARDVW